MMSKACIQCGAESEILPVQLGDIFTLTYLRVCSPGCLFIMAYEYLHEIGYHKQFRNSLYDKQNAEDKDMRTKFVDTVTKEALRSMRQHLEETPELLSISAPDCILKMFEGVPPIPHCSGGTMRFTRPSKQEKIRWQVDHVERLKRSLNEALHDLEDLENE